MIQVYFADTAALNDDALYLTLYNNLSSARREKTDKLRLRNDRNLCLGAGFLLDSGLKKFGLREAERDYGMKGNGKPFFADLPDLRFSLSHSGTVAMAAFSDSEIGCDIEKKREINMAVAKRFFTSHEYRALLKKSSDIEKQELFFRLWTLKESYLKKTGDGLAIPMSSFEICITGDGAAITQNAEENRVFFRELNSFNGYKSAICFEETDPEFQVFFPALTSESFAKAAFQ